MTDTETRPMTTIGKWRKAGRIQKGYQVLNVVKYDKDGTEDWMTVTRVMHILSPLKVSRFTFDNGLSGVMFASDEMFCRTPTEVKKAAK